MFFCRSAWQRCGLLARKAACIYVPRDVLQRRSMSSLPGGTGDNLMYFLLCGGAFAGSVTYTYWTLTTDHARFNERVAEINSRPKTEWGPKPWPRNGGEEEATEDEAAAEGGEEEVVATDDGEEEVVATEATNDNTEAEPIEQEAAEPVSEKVEPVSEKVEPVSEKVEPVLKEAPSLEVEVVVETVTDTTEIIPEVAEVIDQTELEEGWVEVIKVAEVIEVETKEVAAPASAEKLVNLEAAAEEFETERNGTAPSPEAAAC